MGNNHSEGHDFEISAEQCQRPLRFNYDFDRGAHISPNQLVFRKFDHGRASVVGERPLMRNEIICVKVIMFHKGTLKFGITTINPESMNVSEFESMILNNPNALILKMLPRKSIQRDNLLFFQYTTAGEILFGWSKNGKIKEKMTLIGGLETDKPLWAVFDAFGKNIAFRLENELIPPLASVPSEMMKAQNITIAHKSLENIPPEDTKRPERDGDERLRRALSCNKLNQPEMPSAPEVAPDDNQPSSHPHSPQLKSITDFSMFFKLPISTLDQIPTNYNYSQSNSSPTHQYIPRTSSANRTPKTDSKSSLKFHTTTGKNVSVTSDKLSARRTMGSSNAYVFTCRPILADETVSISLNTIDHALKKGLSFGMTVCDPGSLNDLPNDGDDLLDRSEYWVYVRDVVKNAFEGDEVSFSLSRRGRVGMVRGWTEMGRGGGEEKTLVHVDPSVPMWMFFDLTGCVQHISCLGVTKRQSVKKDANFRSDRNFHKNDTIIIPERSNPLHPFTISSSIDISEQTFSRSDEIRNSTNNLRPKIPPRPSTVYTNVPSNKATTTATESFLSMDLPPSLVAPLIPLPSRPSTTPSPNNQLKSSSDSKNSSTNSSRPSINLPIPSKSPSNSAFNPPQSSINPPNSSTTHSTHFPTIQTTSHSAINRTTPPDIHFTNFSTTQPTNLSSATITNNLTNISSLLDFKNTISSLQPQVVEKLLEQIHSLNRPTDQTPNQQSHHNSDHPPNSPECSICLDLPPDCVLYTCGHMCLCHACASDVINSPTPFCPICRQEIKDIVKIYRS